MRTYYRLLFRWRAYRTRTRLAAARDEFYRENPDGHATRGDFLAFRERVRA